MRSLDLRSTFILPFSTPFWYICQPACSLHPWSDGENDPRSLQTHFAAGGVFEAAAVRTAFLSPEHSYSELYFSDIRPAVSSWLELIEMLNLDNL